MDVTSSSAGTFGPCRLDYNRYLLESALGDHSEPHGSGYQGLAVPLWEGAGSDFDQNATPVYFASCPFVNGAGVRRVRIVDCVLREQSPRSRKAGKHLSSGIGRVFGGSS
jgi:hypothetical protein